jgi:hypothetical protein
MKKNGVQSIVLFLLLLCVPLQYVVAQTAGDKGITMEFKDEQLPSVFKRLEKISKYRVLFTYDDLSSYKATGKVENATIEQTLKAIIGDKPLKYHIDGQFINVTLKTERGNKKTIAKVRGKVISAEDGEPVIGASIMVEGTTTGTTTDLDGNFEFSEVPSNAYLIYWYGIPTAESVRSDEYLHENGCYGLERCSGNRLLYTKKNHLYRCGYKL